MALISEITLSVVVVERRVREEGMLWCTDCPNQLTA